MGQVNATQGMQYIELLYNQFAVQVAAEVGKKFQELNHHEEQLSRIANKITELVDISEIASIQQTISDFKAKFNHKNTSAIDADFVSKVTACKNAIKAVKDQIMQPAKEKLEANQLLSVAGQNPDGFQDFNEFQIRKFAKNAFIKFPKSLEVFLFLIASTQKGQYGELIKGEIKGFSTEFCEQVMFQHFALIHLIRNNLPLDQLDCLTINDNNLETYRQLQAKAREQVDGKPWLSDERIWRLFMAEDCEMAEDEKLFKSQAFQIVKASKFDRDDYAGFGLLFRECLTSHRTDVIQISQLAYQGKIEEAIQKLQEMEKNANNRSEEQISAMVELLIIKLILSPNTDQNQLEDLVAKLSQSKLQTLIQTLSDNGFSQRLSILIFAVNDQHLRSQLMLSLCTDAYMQKDTALAQYLLHVDQSEVLNLAVRLLSTIIKRLEKDAETNWESLEEKLTLASDEKKVIEVLLRTRESDATPHMLEKMAGVYPTALRRLIWECLPLSPLITKILIIFADKIQDRNRAAFTIGNICTHFFNLYPEKIDDAYKKIVAAVTPEEVFQAILTTLNSSLLHGSAVSPLIQKSTTHEEHTDALTNIIREMCQSNNNDKMTAALISKIEPTKRSTALSTAIDLKSKLKISSESLLLALSDLDPLLVSEKLSDIGLPTTTKNEINKKIARFYLKRNECISANEIAKKITDKAVSLPIFHEILLQAFSSAPELASDLLDEYDFEKDASLFDDWMQQVINQKGANWIEDIAQRMRNAQDEDGALAVLIGEITENPLLVEKLKKKLQKTDRFYFVLSLGLLKVANLEQLKEFVLKIKNSVFFTTIMLRLLNPTNIPEMVQNLNLLPEPTMPAIFAAIAKHSGNAQEREMVQFFSTEALQRYSEQKLRASFANTWVYNDYPHVDDSFIMRVTKSLTEEESALDFFNYLKKLINHYSGRREDKKLKFENLLHSFVENYADINLDLALKMAENTPDNLKNEIFVKLAKKSLTISPKRAFDIIMQRNKTSDDCERAKDDGVSIWELHTVISEILEALIDQREFEEVQRILLRTPVIARRNWNPIYPLEALLLQLVRRKCLREPQSDIFVKSLSEAETQEAANLKIIEWCIKDPEIARQVYEKHQGNTEELQKARNRLFLNLVGNLLNYPEVVAVLFKHCNQESKHSIVSWISFERRNFADYLYACAEKNPKMVIDLLKIIKQQNIAISQREFNAIFNSVICRDLEVAENMANQFVFTRQLQRTLLQRVEETKKNVHNNAFIDQLRQGMRKLIKQNLMKARMGGNND